MDLLTRNFEILSSVRNGGAFSDPFKKGVSVEETESWTETNTTESKENEYENRNSSHPWKYPDGRNVNFRDLKVRSKNWDSVTWEKYLETFEVRRRESFLKNEQFFDHMYWYEPFDDECFESEEKYRFSRRQDRNFRKVLKCFLTKKEFEVIDLTYFKGIPRTEIAKKLGISTSSVGTRKRNAFKRLRGHLTAFLPYIEENKNFNSKNWGKFDQNIKLRMKILLEQ